ncbi:MAG: MarR family transcriptional regulator [Christensenellaceae bacterium]|nr:MarR family transcriptional regulator [Christensenellaceae bacterium]
MLDIQNAPLWSSFEQLLQAIMELMRTRGSTPQGIAIMTQIGKLEKETPDGGVTISSLAEGLGVSRSAVSQLVGQLEKKGLLRRETSLQDRRYVYAFLTEEGRSFIRREQEYCHYMSELIMHGLEEREKLQLSAVMEKVTGVLRSEKQQLARQKDEKKGEKQYV